MNEIGNVTEVAKGISDFGMSAMIGAVYILLSAAMMIAVFKWFKAIINQIIASTDRSTNSLLVETRKQNDMLCDISEGLRPETQLRLRNLSGFAFDLSVEQVCRLIKKVRTENHIIDHETTDKKIRLLLRNIHEDRKTRFDPFSYRGRTLSVYCNEDWIERVCTVVENELYNPNGADNGRAYTNVKAVYDDIKIDFYHRMNNN